MNLFLSLGVKKQQTLSPEVTASVAFATRLFPVVENSQIRRPRGYVSTGKGNEGGCPPPHGPTFTPH